MSSIFLPSGRIIVFNLNSNQGITILAKLMARDQEAGVLGCGEKGHKERVGVARLT